MPITFLMAFFSCCSSGFLNFLQYSSSSTKARSVSKNRQVRGGKKVIYWLCEVLKCSAINFTFLKTLFTYVRSICNKCCCILLLLLCHKQHGQNGLTTSIQLSFSQNQLESMEFGPNYSLQKLQNYRQSLLWIPMQENWP